MSIDTPTRTELDLYAGVLRAFSKQDLCFTEVPFFGKSVDLVFTGTSIRTIYAVEVKLGDWRSALKQASVNQLFACYSYIAVPDNVAKHLVDKEAEIFKQHGVGILGVSDKAKVLLEAPKSGFIYPKHREHVRQNLQKGQRRAPKSLGVVKDAITAGKRSMELLQARPR